MAQPNPTNIEARVAGMLQQAESRCRDTEEPFELLASLAREISELPECSGVTVWDVRATETSDLLSIGTGGTPLALPPSVQVTGGVQTPSQAASNPADLVSEADVIPGLRIVLAIAATGDLPNPLLDLLADVMADLYRRELLSRLLGIVDRQSGILNLTAVINERFERDHVINVFATDGASVLNADRISVTSRRSGRTWRLVAATGVTDPEQRADAVAVVCRMVEEAAGATDADSQAESTTVVRPLSPAGDWNSATDAAVIEFGRKPTAADASAANILCHSVGAALQNCDRFDNLKPTAQLRRIGRHLSTPRTLAVLVLCGIPLLWLVFGTAELRIDAFGKAVPVLRQNVFAPEGGVITSVAATDDQIVSQGDLLCSIRNDELQILQERLQGELSAATTRLAALETIPRSAANRVSANGLPVSAEKEELKQRVTGLTAQKTIVDQQIAGLVITAPVTGTVHGERIVETLTGRPVQKGQLLLQVADESGPWELELRVPESDIRHVFAARNKKKKPLEVSFVLETDPHSVRRSTLAFVAETTDIDDTGQLSTLVTAQLPETATVDLRPGSGVVARIHCGSAAPGFVLFRKVIEFVERRLLL